MGEKFEHLMLHFGMNIVAEGEVLPNKIFYIHLGVYIVYKSVDF